MSRREGVERLINNADFTPQEGKRLLEISQHPQVSRYPPSFTYHQIRRAKRDPRLWKLYLPIDEEINASGETVNNYGEEENTVLSGLQHKYEPTALLIVSDKCAASCRHCFRRNTARNSQNLVDSQNLGPILKYLQQHPKINNVLLTGGDP